MTNSVITDFVVAINNHDVLAILGALSDDHVFVDAYGTELTGHNALAEAWYTYFKWFPDYTIEIKEMICGNDVYALFGFASGTYLAAVDENNAKYWRLPAAWKAIISEDKISLWQVYCDTKIPSDKMVVK
jgi:ketosteroid isomerase-like protein